MNGLGSTYIVLVIRNHNNTASPGTTGSTGKAAAKQSSNPSMWLKFHLGSSSNKGKSLRGGEGNI